MISLYPYKKLKPNPLGDHHETCHVRLDVLGLAQEKMPDRRLEEIMRERIWDTVGMMAATPGDVRKEYRERVNAMIYAALEK